MEGDYWKKIVLTIYIYLYTNLCVLQIFLVKQLIYYYFFRILTIILPSISFCCVLFPFPNQRLHLSHFPDLISYLHYSLHYCSPVLLPYQQSQFTFRFLKLLQDTYLHLNPRWGGTCMVPYCWRHLTLRTKNPDFQLYLTRKPLCCGLTFMAHDNSMQAPKGGKHQIVLPSSNSSGPRQRSTWQDVHKCTISDTLMSGTDSYLTRLKVYSIGGKSSLLPEIQLAFRELRKTSATVTLLGQHNSLLHF